MCPWEILLKRERLVHTALNVDTIAETLIMISTFKFGNPKLRRAKQKI